MLAGSSINMEIFRIQSLHPQDHFLCSVAVIPSFLMCIFFLPLSLHLHRPSYLSNLYYFRFISFTQLFRRNVSCTKTKKKKSTTLMMEAICCSEIFIATDMITRRHNPKYHNRLSINTLSQLYIIGYIVFSRI